MIGNKNIKRQTGALLLEALMVAFIVVQSWSGLIASDNGVRGSLALSVTPTEQLLFRDSYSSSESLMGLISKIQFVDSEINSIALDLPGLILSSSEALLITSALYNTFYTNTTINAP